MRRIEHIDDYNIGGLGRQVTISYSDYRLLLRVARAAEKLVPASFYSPNHSTEILKAVDALNKPRKP